MPNLGEAGALVSVRNGYFRNYLQPQGFAKLADEGILAAIKAKKEAEEAAARKAVDDAKALANALTMIGKIMVTKQCAPPPRPSAAPRPGATRNANGGAASVCVLFLLTTRPPTPPPQGGR